MKNLVFIPKAFDELTINQALTMHHFDLDTYETYDDLFLAIHENRLSYDRLFVVGYDLHTLFVKLARCRGNICTFVFTKCDAVETPLFSDVNICLFDLAELAPSKMLFLLNDMMVQPQRQSDGYHDKYVTALKERGCDE